MAADVSYQVGFMNGYKEEQQQAMSESSSGGKSTVLMTRDFLGGCFNLDSKELDLDLQVPDGFEKRLDLKSGKVYLQRCNSPISPSSSSDHKNQTNPTVPKLQDLNFPPSTKPSMTVLEETSLDLKLLPSSCNYNQTSVCTLDKVKFALERANRESIKKRSMSKSSSSSHSNSSCSIKETDEYYEGKSLSSLSPPSSSSATLPDGLLFAAGCPGCLLYVLISKSNPKCPRCSAMVPLPMTTKKPRIDLNISM